MKTKTTKAVYFVLMFLPLAVTVIALFFLPDQIPAHYNAANQVDRWGSKFEALILPAMVILFGLFMLGMAKFISAMDKSSKNNETICIIAGLCCLILFNVMTYYFLYLDFHGVKNLSALPLDVNQIMFGLLGIIMILVGNVMPKLRMNSLIGLRTSWSMKNETTWKKSQLFGGISFIAGGILIVVLCLLFKGFSCFLASTVVFFALLAVDIYYTYRIAKKY